MQISLYSPHPAATQKRMCKHGLRPLQSIFLYIRNGIMQRLLVLCNDYFYYAMIISIMQ